MLKSSDLERELRRWREARARKKATGQVLRDRRTVSVKGQEVVVITKPKRSLN